MNNPSRHYFANVATQWDEIRAGFFTEAMRDAAIERAGLPAGALVADVGTGTGFMVAGLLGRAAQVVGFDESTEMLDVARQHFAAHEEVSFQEAEGQSLPAGDSTFDGVFANMYLHHAPDPAAAIGEMARILKPGGVLVITDLDTHEQAWMQEAMADRWVGFERTDIVNWFAAAGLAAVDVDCAEGTCDCTGPQNEDISLSVFVALGRKAA